MKLIQMILHCTFLFSTPVFGQFAINSELKPDVTFGDHNDRFDMSSLIDYQNRYFRADGSVDYRRRHNVKDKHKSVKSQEKSLREAALRSRKQRKKLAKKIRKETDAQINMLANSILLRMASSRRKGEGDGAFPRDIDDKDDDDLNDILARVPTRRSGASQNVAGYRKVGTDPDMFNYGFPIDMKVSGYLLAPENL